MNFGIIASICKDCANPGNELLDRVACKESIARTIDTVMGIFQGEYDLEIMCLPNYEYWREILEHAGSLCVKCSGKEALIFAELSAHIRKGTRADLRLVTKKATVTEISDRKEKKERE